MRYCCWRRYCHDSRLHALRHCSLFTTLGCKTAIITTPTLRSVVLRILCGVLARPYGRPFPKPHLDFDTSQYVIIRYQDSTPATGLYLPNILFRCSRRHPYSGNSKEWGQPVLLQEEHRVPLHDVFAMSIDMYACYVSTCPKLSPCYTSILPRQLRKTVQLCGTAASHKRMPAAISNHHGSVSLNRSWQLTRSLQPQSNITPHQLQLVD